MSSLILLSILVLLASPSLGAPKQSNDASSSTDELEVTREVLQLAQLLFGSKPVEGQELSDYDEIKANIDRVVELASSINRTLDPRTQRRIMILRKLQNLEKKRSCDFQLLLARERMEIREFHSSTRLRMYSQLINHQVYVQCAREIENNLASYDERIAVSSIIQLRNIIIDIKTTQGDMTPVYDNLSFDSLARSIFLYSGQYDGNNWDPSDEKSVDTHMQEFREYVDNTWIQHCSVYIDRFSSYLKEYQWLTRQAHEITVFSRSSSVNWLDSTRICEDLKLLHDTGDLLLHVRYDFESVRSKLLYLGGDEPTIDVTQVNELIIRMLYITRYKERIYGENLWSWSDIAKNLIALSEEQLGKCRTDYLKQFNQFRNAHYKFANLRDYMDIAAAKQFDVCIPLLRAQVQSYMDVVSEWDETEIMTLGYHYESIEPPILQGGYYRRIRKNRFKQGFIAYLESRPEPILMRQYLENSTHLVQLGARYIGEPCSRLVSHLGETKEWFEQLLELGQETDGLSEFDVLWMKNTKLCKHLLNI